MLWGDQDQDLREVYGGLGLAVAEAFTNASVLGAGKARLGAVLENQPDMIFVGGRSFSSMASGWDGRKIFRPLACRTSVEITTGGVGR